MKQGRGPDWAASVVKETAAWVGADVSGRRADRTAVSSASPEPGLLAAGCLRSPYTQPAPPSAGSPFALSRRGRRRDGLSAAPRSPSCEYAAGALGAGARAQTLGRPGSSGGRRSGGLLASEGAERALRHCRLKQAAERRRADACGFGENASAYFSAPLPGLLGLGVIVVSCRGECNLCFSYSRFWFKRF